MSTQISLIDCHTHVFEPKNFELAEGRSYTPGHASASDLARHLERIGASNVVIVQPSPHGTNNEPTLQGIRALGLEKARGVCVVEPEQVAAGDMDVLWRQGIRGVRANLKTAGIDAVDEAARQLTAIGAALADSDMVLQVFLPISVTTKLRETFESLGRPVILDHFGGLKTSGPTIDSDLERLVDVLALPNVVLKLSGACRVTDHSETTAALDDIAPSLLAAAKGRAIWGSDWPHTGKASERKTRPLSEIEPFMPIDDQGSLEDLRRWAGSQAAFNEVTCDTPTALFGF